MKNVTYIDKRFVILDDLIMFVIDEFGNRELKVIAKVVELKNGDIFVDELWTNANYGKDYHVKLKNYYYIETNFGNVEWHGIDELKNKLPEYFI